MVSPVKEPNSEAQINSYLSRTTSINSVNYYEDSIPDFSIRMEEGMEKQREQKGKEVKEKCKKADAWWKVFGCGFFWNNKLLSVLSLNNHAVKSLVICYCIYSNEFLWIFWIKGLGMRVFLISRQIMDLTYFLTISNSGREDKKTNFLSFAWDYKVFLLERVLVKEILFFGLSLLSVCFLRNSSTINKKSKNQNSNRF